MSGLGISITVITNKKKCYCRVSSSFAGSASISCPKDLYGSVISDYYLPPGDLYFDSFSWNLEQMPYRSERKSTGNRFALNTYTLTRTFALVAEKERWSPLTQTNCQHPGFPR
jgi:hypothetical protein